MPARPPLSTLHVDTARTWRGGQRQVLLLASGLERCGIAAAIACPPGSALGERARGEGLTVIELPLRGEWDLASTLRLRRLAGDGAFDVIHAHDAHAVTLAGLATLGLPILRIAARRVDFRPSRAGVLKLRHLAHRVIAISAAVRDVLTAAGVPGEKLSVVPSGIEISPPPAPELVHEARRGLGLAPHQPVVGTVGALVDHKDHLNFIDAAACLYPRSDLRFVIVGEGELEPVLRQRIAERQLTDRVILAGFQRDPRPCLANFTVFALSSKLEGLGTAVLDAMAAGVPVVATRTGGVPEAVEHGVTGLLVPPREPVELAGAILRLLDDADLRARLAGAARQRVAERFTAAAMVAGTLTVYQELLAQNPRRR